MIINVYKALYRKLKIKKHEPYDKLRVNSGTQRGITVFLLHMKYPWCFFLTTRTSSDRNIMLDASICEDNYISLTTHKNTFFLRKNLRFPVLQYIIYPRLLRDYTCSHLKHTTTFINF